MRRGHRECNVVHISNLSLKSVQLIWRPSTCFSHSKLLNTVPLSGATKKPLTLREGRLGLTRRRPNFPPTGTHPSPRSASVWRSMTTSPSLLLSTSRRTPCTLWSLMGNTATPRWVVTRGSRWLVLMHPCSTTVTRKGSMLLVIIVVIPKQESVSLVTSKTIAPLATLELDLALVESMMTATHVETRLHINQIMAISILRQWDTFWCSEKKLIWANLLLLPWENYFKGLVVYYLWGRGEGDHFTGCSFSKTWFLGGHFQLRKRLIPRGHFNKFHESSKKAVRSLN